MSSQGKSISFIGAIVGVASIASNLAVAQSQTPPPAAIADNDSIYIDGKTFSITPGRAKGDTSTQIQALGARDLGPGAIVFRSGEKLYIVAAPVLVPSPQNQAGPNISGENIRPNRVTVEYGVPKSPELQELYGMLREHRVLEDMQGILSPFRLPEELTIKTTECGMVNSWYSRENSKPTVTLCYELLRHILQSLPKNTGPAESRRGTQRSGNSSGLRPTKSDTQCSIFSKCPYSDMRKMLPTTLQDTLCCNSARSERAG